MNAIVVMALKRPYTFVVLAILILIYGVLAAVRTPTDIFPNIRIPVVAVVWTYTGLTPEDMSGRVIYYDERSLTSTVDNIEHIESQSLYGRGIVKSSHDGGLPATGAGRSPPGRPRAHRILRPVPEGFRTPIPGIKSDEIDMHFRAPMGLRIEESSKIAALVDMAVRKVLPGHVTNVISNCGLPISGINQAYSASGTIGPQDCDLTISLNDGYRGRHSINGGRRFPAARLADAEQPSGSVTSSKPQALPSTPGTRRLPFALLACRAGRLININEPAFRSSWD